MTCVWLVVRLIANNVGGNEPLVLDPGNAWTATLILAIALDLGAAHATRTRPAGRRARQSGRAETRAGAVERRRRRSG